jgi:hypothetical protein
VREGPRAQGRAFCFRLDRPRKSAAQIASEKTSRGARAAETRATGRRFTCSTVTVIDSPLKARGEIPHKARPKRPQSAGANVSIEASLHPNERPTLQCMVLKYFLLEGSGYRVGSGERTTSKNRSGRYIRRGQDDKS